MSEENKKKSRLPFWIKLARYLLVLFVSYTIFTALLLFMFKWIDPPITAIILERSERKEFNIFHSYDYKQTWHPFNKISKNAVIAVIASEDQRFIEHNGFDFDQIQKAIEEIDKRKRVRGASTITQQVAKNLFLTSSKLYVRKVLEAYYTVMIELIWSKRRIMEVYLNIAQFGKDVYGIEEGSALYFHKSSSYINSSEAALLAALLPSPERYGPNRITEHIRKRRERIARQMMLMGGTKALAPLYD